MSKGLVGYWPMNEASGTKVADVVGGAHGTAHGAKPASQGKLGGARDFGTNADVYYVKLPMSIAPLTVKPHTLSFWMYPRAAQKKGQLLFSTSRGMYTAGSYVALNIDAHAGGRLNTNITNGKYYCLDGDKEYMKTLVVDNKWQHVVMVYTNSGYSYYLNGKLDATGPGGTCGGTVKYAPIFGYQNDMDSNRGFEGKLDELALWNRALTAKEVEALWAGGAGLTHPASGNKGN